MKFHTFGQCAIKISCRKVKNFLGSLLSAEDCKDFSDFIECSKEKR